MACVREAFLPQLFVKKLPLGVMDKFEAIKKVLNNYVTHLNKKYIKRYSKITFRYVLCELSIKTINNTGYDNAT